MKNVSLKSHSATYFCGNSLPNTTLGCKHTKLLTKGLLLILSYFRVTGTIRYGAIHVFSLVWPNKLFF